MSAKRTSKLLSSMTNVLRSRVFSRKRNAMLTNKQLANYTWELAYSEEAENKNIIAETHKDINIVMLNYIAILLLEKYKFLDSLALEKKYVKQIKIINEVVGYKSLSLYQLYDNIFDMINIKDNNNATKLAFITKKGLNDIWFSKDKIISEIIEMIYERAININNVVNEYIINDHIMERAETNAVELFKCASNILRLIKTNTDITSESNKYAIYKKEEKEILVDLNKVQINSDKLKKYIIDIKKRNNYLHLNHTYLIPVAKKLIQNAIKNPTYTNTSTTIYL
jgi:hypothetical protein